MKIKLNKDHKIINTETCGELREILSAGEHPALDLAIIIDVRPTKAHFHKGIDEIYFMLDGTITLQTFDPATNKTEETTLGANELCLITKGIHHRVKESSEKNRLCVICCPKWEAKDEFISNIL